MSQRDRAVKKEAKEGAESKGWQRNKAVKYIRKGRKKAKKRLSAARRRVDKEETRDG